MSRTVHIDVVTSIIFLIIVEPYCFRILVKGAIKLSGFVRFKHYN